MNKTRSMLAIIMSAAAVAVADPQASPNATPPVAPPNLTPPAVPAGPVGGPRAGAQGNPMMRRFMGGDSVGMILRALAGDPRSGQDLGLSEAQVKEIKDSMAASDQAMTELSGKLEQAALRQVELWKADTLDEEALMKIAGETSDLNSQLAKLRVKQALAALKILTPEQRAKLREGIKQRMGQMPQRVGAGLGRQPGAGAMNSAVPAPAPVPNPATPPAPAPVAVPVAPPAAPPAAK